MAVKHFVIYYHRGAGTYVLTEPRPWAREKQQLFPKFDFNNNHPTTDYIENLLIENRSFQRMIENNKLLYFKT